MRLLLIIILVGLPLVVQARPLSQIRQEIQREWQELQDEGRTYYVTGEHGDRLYRQRGNVVMDLETGETSVVKPVEKDEDYIRMLRDSRHRGQEDDGE